MTLTLCLMPFCCSRVLAAVLLMLAITPISHCANFRVPLSKLLIQKTARTRNDTTSHPAAILSLSERAWPDLWRKYKVMADEVVLPKKPEETMQEFITRCKLMSKSNDAEAQHSLGICFYCGLGVPIDWKRSIRYFRRAAKQGHVEAKMHLGHTLMEIDQEGESTLWFAKAFEHGIYDDVSVIMVGVARDRGLFGMEQNQSFAFDCFCLCNSRSALGVIAEWCHTGTCISQNYTRAFQMVNLSIARGQKGSVDLLLARYLAVSGAHRT